MITARKQSTGINLLPKEEFAASTLGRILTWLLSTFRIIVIITEVIVMGAFLSRFWLDAKANDLNDSITSAQSILSTTTDFENEFRDIQTKLQTFSKITKLQTNPSEFLAEVSKNLPPDITLNSFQIAEDSIQIKGNSISESAITQFMTNLKNNAKFSDISLIGANTSQQNTSLIVFSIQIKLKKGTEK